MPLQQILPTWLSLNSANFTSPTALTDVRTGLPFAAGGLNVGDYFDLTQEEAKSLSNTSVGTLLAGRYRFVQVDSGATQANVATGTVGLLKNLTGSTYAGPINNVTSYDKALTLNSPRKVVFLNAVTPGNFGFIQELGDATILINTVESTTGVGSVVNITSSGVDAPSSQTVTPALVGIAEQAPVAATLTICSLTAPAFQE
jgi:hypothetical protein